MTRLGYREGSNGSTSVADLPRADRLAFRNALGAFATGVAVVTATTADGRPIGLTISSFNSVSLDPPLVLFSLARSALSLEAMLVASGFAVNILEREQQGLSDRFARALSDKWAAVQHELGQSGAPLLADAIAHFECEPHAQYDGGDHIIFLARVVRFSTKDGEPLVFFRGSYRQLARDARAPAWPLPIHY